MAKQREAGIDIGNNGEQQREAFFLYLRERLSGLGGSWQRPTRADVDAYPQFQKMFAQQHAGRVECFQPGGSPEGDRRR